MLDDSEGHTYSATIYPKQWGEQGGKHKGASLQMLLA